MHVPVLNKFVANFGKGAQQDEVQSLQVRLKWFLVHKSREWTWTLSKATKAVKAQRSARDMPKFLGESDNLGPSIGGKFCSWYSFSWFHKKQRIYFLNPAVLESDAWLSVLAQKYANNKKSLFCNFYPNIKKLGENDQLMRSWYYLEISLIGTKLWMI